MLQQQYRSISYRVHRRCLEHQRLYAGWLAVVFCSQGICGGRDLVTVYFVGRSVSRCVA